MLSKEAKLRLFNLVKKPCFIINSDHETYFLTLGGSDLHLEEIANFLIDHEGFVKINGIEGIIRVHKYEGLGFVVSFMKPNVINYKEII